MAEGKRDLWLNVHSDLASATRIKTVTAFLGDLIASDPAFSAVR